MSFWPNSILDKVLSLFGTCSCYLKRKELSLNSCAECYHLMTQHEHHSARRSFGWDQCLLCKCQSGRRFKDNLEFVEVVAKLKGLV